MLISLFQNILKETGIASASIIRGLCSSGMWQKYRSGAARPEKLLEDALWQRTGKSSEKFETFLSHEEYTAAVMRCRIQSQLRHNLLAEADTSIREYKISYPALAKSPLHKQFLALQQAELFRRLGKDDEFQKKEILHGLSQTLHTPLSPEIFFNRDFCFSSLEMLLLERYAILFAEPEPGRALEWFSAMIRFIKSKNRSGLRYDLAEQTKLLPIILYHSAKLLSHQKNFPSALECLRDACSLLSYRQNYSALFVQCKELEFEILRRNGQAPPAWELACYELVIRSIPRQDIWRQYIYPEYYELGLFDIGQTIQNRRAAKGISLLDFSTETELDFRTLEKIEAGKQNPHQNTRQIIFSKINLSACRRSGIIFTKHHFLFRRTADLTKAFHAGNLELAEQIFREIAAAKQDENQFADKTANRQFFRRWELSFAYKTKKISRENYIAQLWKLLNSTFRDSNEDGQRCIMTRNELEILLDIAVAAPDNYHATIDRLENILSAQYKRFCEQPELSDFFPFSLRIVAYHLAYIYRIRKQFDLAEKVLDTALDEVPFSISGMSWGRFYFQRFRVEKDKRETRLQEGETAGEFDFSSMRYAYAISRWFMRNEQDTKCIENFLNKYYGNADRILADLKEDHT